MPWACVFLWLCFCMYGAPMCAWASLLRTGCRFPSVVSGPKVSNSTVTFSPSQHLLCLTKMVRGSSSADDTRPSSVGCMWGGRRVTGPGWEMAADTGVTEPKGHEESHRDGENTEGWRRITREEDNFSGKRWRLSHALLLCLCVFLSSTPGSPLPLSPYSLCSRFLSLSRSLSAARSTALLAPGNAVCSPLSLCDGGMACGVKGRWSDGGLQRRKTHPLSLFCWPWTWTQLIIYCVYVNLQNVIADVLVILKGQFTRITKGHMAFLIFSVDLLWSSSK